MKNCKYCKTEIPANAKICPNCKQKQGKPIWLILLIIFIVACAVFGASTNNNNKEFNNAINNPQSVEYLKVSKDTLDDDLKNNAASAKDKYDGKYIEVSGKLGTIDSDLKYISVMSSTNDWDINGIHCTIKNDDQRAKVKSLTAKQKITIRGKVTSVGEVLGYSVDLIDIVE